MVAMGVSCRSSFSAPDILPVLARVMTAAIGGSVGNKEKDVAFHEMVQLHGYMVVNGEIMVG
eukprot:14257693-Ditylum_brightwellii.AAC.1